jgi:capsular polysaccharide biosynthesis protein
MSIRELIRICRRQWIILSLALMISVIAIVGAYVLVPVKYQSQAQMTMLNSEAVTNQMGDLGNPYLSFSQTLSADVDLLTRLLVSDSSARQLAAEGVTDSYTAAFANNALGPFMQLTVTGKNKAHVLSSLNTLVAYAQQSWYSLQRASNAPQKTIIRLDTITPPSSPAPVKKTKIELVAGVAVGSLIISLILITVVDNRRGKRRYRDIANSAHANTDADAHRERPDSIPSMR